MAPSEVTLKFGAESQVFELEPGGELNALAIKDCFGLQTVKLDGKVVSVNQSNGLTYRTFQHGETISVEGTAGVGSADFKALQDQVAAQGHENSCLYLGKCRTAVHHKCSNRKWAKTCCKRFKHL